MCRAGKDKTRRYCPATTDKERIAERKARRRFDYMNQKGKQRYAAAEAEIAAHPEYDDDTKKKIMADAGYKMNDLLYQRHLGYAHEVIQKLRKTGKETDKLHAKRTSVKTDENGEPIKDASGKIPKGELMWDEDRAAIHAEIIQEQLEKWKDVPRNGEAIFSGGLGGAGKGTVLSKYANIDSTQYATLNPDDIKEILAAKGMIPQIDGLTPMEASPLVHEEASYITGQLAKIVTLRKMNVIHDLTMASYDNVKRKAEHLQASGYTKVEAIFVDIDIDTSSERADIRHLNGHNRFIQGKGHGGRILPLGLSAEQVPKDNAYRSKNAENFLQLNADGLFDNIVAYDNNVRGRDPIKLDSLKTNVKEDPAV